MGTYYDKSITTTGVKATNLNTSIHDLIENNDSASGLIEQNDEKITSFSGDIKTTHAAIKKQLHRI